ncbi:unnamed protein product [Symbiodinium natans]|uniref:SLC26A/SulP transporter domain-containing protein n=1 Tax=Symbiodinium natans TaxID=878477 RepID=A0A812R8U5_9DINO|nr:unnamed protein product [Symbiodinium natans]
MFPEVMRSKPPGGNKHCLSLLEGTAGLASLIPSCFAELEPRQGMNSPPPNAVWHQQVLKCYRKTLRSLLKRLLRLPGVEVQANWAGALEGMVHDVVDVVVATALGTVLSTLRAYEGDVVGEPPRGAKHHSFLEDPTVVLTGWIRQYPWDMPIADTVQRLGGWPYAVLSAVAFAGVDYLAIISVEAERPAPGGSRPTRELAGQGIGCIASGMAGSAPVGGSLTRSMLAGMIGASSPLMGLVCGFATMGLAFPQVSKLLQMTPKAVLSSTVIAAVLPAVVTPKDLLRLSGPDALAGWATAAATCTTDPTKGFGIGLVVYTALFPVRRLFPKKSPCKPRSSLWCQKQLDKHAMKIDAAHKAVELVVKKWLLGDTAGLKNQVYHVWSKWSLRKAESEKKLNAVHMSLAKWARGDAKGVMQTVFLNWKQDAMAAASERSKEEALLREQQKLDEYMAAERERYESELAKHKSEEPQVDKFFYRQAYAAARSDYYLRRAYAFKDDADTCLQFLEVAVEISPENSSVVSRAQTMPCKFQELLLPPASTDELAIGPVRRWAEHPWPRCTAPADAKVVPLFGTPLGFLHISELGLRDWQKTLQLFGTLAMKKFTEVQRKNREAFVHVNNHFFQHQETNPAIAMDSPDSWPELYSSQEYKEWAESSIAICSSFLDKMGVPLTKEEREEMEVVTWAAVYPTMKAEDPVTHYYHAHQESIVSFVLYAKMPEPTTPLTISDPRGAPPIEDFEWFQDKGDMGVDGEPPFHRPAAFYAEEGDILIFPSFAIHKVPPHIGRGTRVVFPSNCHLPKRRRKLSGKHKGSESPLDGWERIAKPQAPVARPEAVPNYAAHATAALDLAEVLQDPYMKMWEVQNQVVAMLQFGVSDASAWLAAGNISARVAVILDMRGEGQYYLDAALMFARAILLDASVRPQVEQSLKDLIPQKVPKKYKAAFNALKHWRKLILSWGDTPPEIEMTQFLHPELNGADRCSRMCPEHKEPSLRTLRLLRVFSTQVYVLQTRQVKEVEEAVAELLEADVPGASIVSSPALVHAKALSQGPWLENRSASMMAVLCDASASVSFADPRGKWNRQWSGSVPVKGELLAQEPKAPFHWHTEVRCEEGEAILFPAWLGFKLSGTEAVRPYSFAALRGGAPLRSRAPRPPPLCTGGAEDPGVVPRADEL